MVVPFCIWGVVCTLTSAHEPYYKIFIRPDLSLWFLWVLFVINVAFYCGQLLALILRIRSNIFTLIATFIALQVLSSLGRGMFGLGLASTHFLYFAIGVAIGQHKKRLTESAGITILGLVLFIAYILMASVWYRISTKIPSDLPQWITTLNEYRLYHISTALCGSLGFILLFVKYMNCVNTRWISYLGLNTLGIYAIHQSVIWSLIQVLPTPLVENLPTIPGAICSFAMVLAITISILELFKINKYTSTLFLGAKHQWSCLNKESHS